MSMFPNNPHVIESGDVDELLDISAKEDGDSAVITLTVRLRAGVEAAVDGEPLMLFLDGNPPKILSVIPAPQPAPQEEVAPAPQEPAAVEPPQEPAAVEPPQEPPAPQEPPRVFEIEDKGASHES